MAAALACIISGVARSDNTSVVCSSSLIVNGSGVSDVVAQDRRIIVPRWRVSDLYEQPHQLRKHCEKGIRSAVSRVPS